eukprot:scaffold74463_cov25-Tisochrysis_lutea.AAC.1
MFKQFLQLLCCAEFWERYVRWLEGKGMEAEARGALQRQVEVFCKTRPEAHLFAARFEERHGRAQVGGVGVRKALLGCNEGGLTQL